MPISDDLLAANRDIWAAQKAHPFVTELAAGTLDEAAFRCWVEQDYRYLLEYARTFALASASARDEATMTTLADIAHQTLADEMDLHREFAAEYDLSPDDLAGVRQAPTCVAYTNFLVRTAATGSLAETIAAVYPCLQGYRDVAVHAADLADGEHRFTPWIELYTGAAFGEEVATLRELVDRCGERWPGEHDAMHAAFETSARLELAFWEMAYTQETWPGLE